MVRDLLVIQVPHASNKGMVAIRLRPIDCFFLSFESAEHVVLICLDDIVVNGRSFRAALGTSLYVNVPHSRLSPDILVGNETDPLIFRETHRARREPCTAKDNAFVCSYVFAPRTELKDLLSAKRSSPMLNLEDRDVSESSYREFQCKLPLVVCLLHHTVGAFASLKPMWNDKSDCGRKGWVSLTFDLDLPPLLPADTRESYSTPNLNS